MTTEEVILSKEKKHVKIYLLSKLGLSNKEVAGTLGTNVGHVYNVLKEYTQNDVKKNYADMI